LIKACENEIAQKNGGFVKLYVFEWGFFYKGWMDVFSLVR